ncbi:MAG: DUF1822 family protein [Cyanobacteria bacterium P01_C01_bin.38]
MLQFDDLIQIHPEHLWIKFSDRERETVLSQIANNNRLNNVVANRLFVNRLCLNTFAKWLEDEPDLREQFKITTPFQELNRQWEFVNGFDVNFDQTRLVMVPTEQSLPTEFRIPQEWVDIPSWAANYYLAVQLNVEEGWLRVWGFISHEQVRKKAEYDSIDKTYCVSNHDLIADIDIIWVAKEIYKLRKPQVKDLTSLPEIKAKNMIEELSKSNVYSPRLHIDFAEWGAILAYEKYRSILYSQKIKPLQVNFMKNTQKAARNLSLWFENVFDGGFCSVDDLSSLSDAIAFQFRNDSVLNEVCVKGAKLIDFGMQLESSSIFLLIGLLPQVDNKVGIRVQLYPASGETYLPDSVQLALLSESGTTLQSVESRSYDNYIQLKRFKLPLGKNFSIQVAWNEIVIKENFVLEAIGC